VDTVVVGTKDNDDDTANITTTAVVQKNDTNRTVKNSVTNRASTTVRGKDDNIRTPQKEIIHAEKDDVDDGTAAAAAALAAGRTDTNLWSTSPIMSKKRIQFLDRIAVLASSLTKKEASSTTASVLDQLSSSFLLQQNSSGIHFDAITPQSDLTLPGRHIHIVTTAALPWFTGTAVNPLLRAAYLHRTTQQINRSNVTTSQQPKKRWVTLVIPWLELPEDQELLFNGRIFQNENEQEQYIRDWLRNDADMPDAACAETGLEILFYPGRYHSGLGSIFAMGDIIDTIVNIANATTTTTTTTVSINSTSPLALGQQQQLDVCVLEEPEHCNWYRAPGDGWTKRFNYVIGIVHTSKWIHRVCWYNVGSIPFHVA
jgi:hypothetical protein